MSHPISRHYAGSEVISVPSASVHGTPSSTSSDESDETTMTIVAECGGGNVPLMMARLSALTVSIRALDRSNVALREALQKERNHEDADDEHEDAKVFREALVENRNVIRRQAHQCTVLVGALQQRGIRSMAVDPDVRRALDTVVRLEEEEAHGDDDDDGTKRSTTEEEGAAVPGTADHEVEPPSMPPQGGLHL